MTYFPFALLCPNPLNISDVYLTYVGEHEHLNNFWSELLEAGDGPIVGDEWRPVAAERVTEHLRHARLYVVCTESMTRLALYFHSR